MKRIVLAIVLALAFFTSSIQITNAEAENISEGKILEMRVTERIIRVFQENATYPQECDNDRYFIIFNSGKGDFSLLDVLLTAYQSGWDVRFKTSSECVVGVDGTTAQIEEIWLK